MERNFEKAANSMMVLKAFFFSPQEDYHTSPFINAPAQRSFRTMNEVALLKLKYSQVILLDHFLNSS